MGEDRTWTLYMDGNKGGLRWVTANGPHFSDRESVSVVEESRLREAEAERDSVLNGKGCVSHEQHLHVIEALVAERERVEAELREAREALRDLRDAVDAAAANGRDSHYWPDHVEPFVGKARDRAWAVLEKDKENTRA